jgi:hypothetical protein
MSDPGDPRLRFRVFVDSELAAEHWLDTEAEGADAELERFKAAHARLTDLAEAGGLPWMVEVYDPDQPEDEAYVRFGSDPRGMVRPIEVVNLPPFPGEGELTNSLHKPGVTVVPCDQANIVP